MKKTITKAKKAMFWIWRRDHQTPNCGKGAPAGFSDVQEDAQEDVQEDAQKDVQEDAQEDVQEDAQEDVQEDAQEDAQEEGPGEEGAGEESAEEEGVQQYVPRYATMEEYAVGVKKAKGSQTIDTLTVSSC